MRTIDLRVRDKDNAWKSLHLQAVRNWAAMPFNRLALKSDYNVVLPAILRACLKTAFAVYALQGVVFLTHPWGVGDLVWLAVLNVAPPPSNVYQFRSYWASAAGASASDCHAKTRQRGADPQAEAGHSSSRNGNPQGRG